MPINWTKPVRIKGTNRLLRVLCTDALDFRNASDPSDLLTVVLLAGDTGNIYRATASGEIYAYGYSVENVPEERFVYLNMYANKDYSGGHFESRAEADEWASSPSARSGGRISCQKVKVEPGRFDD